MTSSIFYFCDDHGVSQGEELNTFPLNYMTNVFVVLILEFNNVRGENLKRFSMPDSKKKK